MKSTSVPALTLLSDSFGEPWKPMPYQMEAVTFLLEHACAGLFLDPGLGKTAITLAAIKILKQKKLTKKVLLIAPLRVCELVWPKEQRKWVDFHGLKLIVLHGPNKDQLLNEHADIYVINPEGLEWLMQVQKTRTPRGKIKVSLDMARWTKLGFDLLVIDELSKFKHTSSGRFKTMKLVLHTFRRRWGLTGSPAANGLLDLFGQCYMLDQGRSLGPYITHYRMRFFIPVDEKAYVWVIRPLADQEIYKQISPLVLRMADKDYLQMPELIVNTIKVELPAKVRRMYDQLEDDLITKVLDNVVTAASVGVASMKCRQIANGGVYLDPQLEQQFKLKSSREWVNLHTEKVDALADLIEELQGSPLLVAYDFEHDLDRLRIKFGNDIPYIGGGVSSKRAIELEGLWNKGQLPVLFGHPQAMAHGLNLQERSQHVAWHSQTWDYELYDQFIRRVLRQGNSFKRVFVHHIIAKDTIDELMMAAIRRKHKGQQAFFDGLKALAVHRKGRKNK